MRSSSPAASKPQKTDHCDADVPYTTKVNNVVTYTKDKVSPILVQIKELIVKAKVEAEAAAPATNGSS